MTLTQVFLTLLTVILLSLGQILFKMVSGEINFAFDKLLHSLFNPKLILAFAVYFAATFMWLGVLKTAPLRVAYPFVALAFFIVPIMAHYFLKESLSWNTFVGGMFIAVGVVIATYK